MRNQQLPGVQLYSVRDQINENPNACIQRLSKLGFKTAEGFDLVVQENIQPFLKEHDLKVSSSFLLWSHITGRYDLAEKYNYPWLPEKPSLEKAIEQAQALGLSTLVCGYLFAEERADLNSFQKLADDLNRAGETISAAGMTLLYHNHAFEFKPLTNGQLPYELLLQNTQENLVNFELDVLWATLAGQSLPTLIQKMATRLKQLHLKTGAPVEQPLFDEQAYPVESHDHVLGTGTVNMADLLNTIDSHNTEALFIEQEFSQDIYTSLGLSLKNLTALMSIA